MEELNPKQSGQLAGSADNIMLLQKLHASTHPAHIVVDQLPPTVTHTSVIIMTQCSQLLETATANDMRTGGSNSPIRSR